MYAKVCSMGIFGLDGYPVVVEADTAQGLPAFDLVGLPDAAVSESRNRVRAAVKNSGFSFPVSRITVNLAPADKRKTGPLYDLPVLLAILLATGQAEFSAGGRAFLGELSLQGELRPVTGVLPIAIAAKKAGIKELYLPEQNAAEAAIAEGLAIYGVRSVPQLIGHLTGNAPLRRQKAVPFTELPRGFEPDFCDVKGQAAARRAVEIAAAGGHNILLIGPPGAGKSMLAKRIPSILPPLSYQESIETTQIYSVAGALAARPVSAANDEGALAARSLVPRPEAPVSAVNDEGSFSGGNPLLTVRPFRAPHHTVSPAGLSGGGAVPRPGEISLSHNGVLFLDELPEFSRTAMEVLRQPVEDGVVTISRAAAALTYPCSVMLVAAMNPCPCGNFGSPGKECHCNPFAVERYLSRISGPLLDRIDLHVEVLPVDYAAMSERTGGEPSKMIRERVGRAREIQAARYENRPFSVNAKIPPSLMKETCRLSPEAEKMLHAAFERLGFSARAYDKVLKMSRTIADLGSSDRIERQHVAEAVQYRALDKKYWNR